LKQHALILLFTLLSTVIVSYYVVTRILVILLVLFIFFIAPLTVILIEPFFAFLTFASQHILILTLIPALVLINVLFLGSLVS
jgi:hypothetical protein